jgi:hypothetical protein
MAGTPNASYGISRKLAAAKAHEFSLVTNYKMGYRNREDVTNLPPGVLITGSQNIMTNLAERIQVRQGYAVDGTSSTVAGPILASFDWLTRNNTEVHVRAGGLTSAGNDGKLQYRYVDSAGVVTWRDLTTALTTVAYNFTTWWNTTESEREMLYVNGTANVFRWNGSVTTIASATVNTVTKQGTDTWTDTGFYTTGTRTIVIGGVSATYSGGEGTTTLTGVSVDFSNTGTYPVGSIAHQLPITTAVSGMTTITATFAPGLISTLNNQIFLGALKSSVLWISKVNSYTDYSASTPRQVGEGASLILDANLVALDPQENFMYVSAGQDLWYNVNFSLQTSAVGVTYEQVNALRLKTGRRQGAISQAFVSHMKNNIIVATQEVSIDTFGRVETSLATPQTKNISDPIKLDIDSYDFTDGSIAYWRYYLLVAIPKEGIVLMYNFANASWESPQTLPISRFYIVNGELYGHSYSSFESYELFTGYADRVYSGFAGYPINAIATFSYQNFGTRSTYKKANAFYMEGYINASTILNITLTYELDGCATTRTFTIDGSDTQIVCIPKSLASLGKESLGKVKLGGSSQPSIQNLPPKFRVEKTFNNKDFFECSMSFSILGVDQNFQLLAFGLNAGSSSSEPVQIRQ